MECANMQIQPSKWTFRVNIKSITIADLHNRKIKTLIPSQSRICTLCRAKRREADSDPSFREPIIQG